MRRHPKPQVGGTRAEIRVKSAPTEVHHVPCSLLVRRVAGQPLAHDRLHPWRGSPTAMISVLVPLTRGQGAAALQFEVELGNLDQLDQVRHHGGGADEDSGSWMHAFSEILVSPPGVEILRVDEMPAP